MQLRSLAVSARIAEAVYVARNRLGMVVIALQAAVFRSPSAKWRRRGQLDLLRQVTDYGRTERRNVFVDL